MGIRGLKALVTKKKGAEAKALGPSTVLHVDGIGFALWVCESLSSKLGPDCGFELGGPYNLLRVEYGREINALKDHGIRLVFYMDGKLISNPLKSATLASRMEQKEKAWSELFSACLDDLRKGEKQKIPPQGRLPFPYLAVDELRSVLASLGVETVECDGEADQDIAMACDAGNSSSSEEEHYVVSSDTDFLLFPGVELIFTGEHNVADVKVWSRARLAKELLLREESLVELGILIGNDATSAIPRSRFDLFSFQATEVGEQENDEDATGDSEAPDDDDDVEDEDDDSKLKMQSSHFACDFNRSTLNLLIKVIRTAEQSQGMVQVTASACPELQLAIEYSRKFYALEDLSEYYVDEEEDEEVLGEEGEERESKVKESTALTDEQVEDIRDYCSESTPENVSVSACACDVIVYLQQAAVFEEQLTDLHCEALGLMQEALSEALSDKELSGKLEHPMCARPQRIKWTNVVAAQAFQRTFKKFQTFSAHCYDSSSPSNAPSGLFDGHLFHAICTHLEEKAKTSAVQSTVHSPPSAATSPATASQVSREKLPIDDHRENIIARISSERVTIIHGETGCGKSSRLPIFLLENAESRGEPCRMFVSQPRRIAASSLMKRVRDTLGDKVGLRMGHGIIDEKESTVITFVTTGYLLRLLANYPEVLSQHTHLIIDEVHERSVDGDVLCLLARRLLAVNPTIRLILMSATVHTKLYRDYFSTPGQDYGSLDVLSVGVRRFPVQVIYTDDLAKDQNLPSSLKMGFTKKITEMTSGRTRGRSEETVPQQLAKDQYSLAVALIRSVAKVGTAVLVFVSGMNDITEMIERFDGLGRYFVVAIHSELPFEEQEAAFDPTPPDQVKVVVATNSAESSITLPDVDMVICFGTHKALRYNSSSHRVQLVNTWISKASGTQRAGRTGRVRPGVVYRLYSRSLFEGFDDHEMSEVHRRPLQDVILDLRTMLEDSAGFDGVVPILKDLLEPPDMNNVQRSFEYLHRAGMITVPADEGALTSIGRLAGCLPVDLTLGRLVAWGVTLGVGTEATVFASALSQQRSPFRIASPMIHSTEEYIEIVKQTVVGAAELDGGVYSEPIMLLLMFIRWLKMDYAERNQWCSKHGLAHARMRQFVSSTSHLVDRVNTALQQQSFKQKKKGGKREDVVSLDLLPDANISDKHLNTYRLILAWSADGNLIRLNPQKKKMTSADYTSVTLTGEPVTHSHLSPLFPESSSWVFENSLRRIFDAPFSASRHGTSSLEVLQDLASCVPASGVSASSVVWVVQQLPVKPNGREGDISLVVAISEGEDFSENVKIFKGVFGLSLSEGGKFKWSRGATADWHVFWVAMLSKSELIALNSMHEHLQHGLAMLIPREGNAKLTCTNIVPDEAQVRSIFWAADSEREPFRSKRIAQSVQACKQIIKFENPFEAPKPSPKPSKARKGKQKTAAPATQEPRRLLVFDIPLGIRLLNSYSAGQKDRKMRISRVPQLAGAGKSRSSAGGAPALMTAAVEERSLSANPYHAAKPNAQAGGPVVGSKQWQNRHRSADKDDDDEDGNKMLMPYKTVSSTWIILQLRIHQVDSLNFPSSASSASMRKTFVVHSGPALMPRQSLQAVAVHCGKGLLWGVTHNTLFLGGGQQGGTQELVRCEGITLVPPGRRWLSLALQCGGMDHGPVDMQSIADKRELVSGPHDVFLDEPLSRLDVERCQAFFQAMEQHQLGPVVRNEALIQNLTDIFSPWLFASSSEANAVFEEGKMEQEFLRNQQRVIEQDKVKVNPKLAGGGGEAASSAKKSKMSKQKKANPDGATADLHAKKSPEAELELSQGKLATPAVATTGGGTGGGERYRCPECPGNKTFTSVHAIVCHFDATGHTHAKDRKRGDKKGVREACRVAQDTQAPVDSKSKSKSVSDEKSLEDAKAFAETLIAGVISGEQFGMGRVWSDLGRIKKGAEFNNVVVAIINSDSRITTAPNPVAGKGPIFVPR